MYRTRQSIGPCCFAIEDGFVPVTAAINGLRGAANRILASKKSTLAIESAGHDQFACFPAISGHESAAFFKSAVQKKAIVTTMPVTMNKRWSMNRENIERLNCVTVAPPTTGKIDRIAVYCHGFGAPGDDLVGLAEPIVRAADSNDESFLLVFPAAPIDLSRYGMPGGRAWWPLMNWQS